MDGSVGEPGHAPSPDAAAVVVLARICDTLIREDDPGKAVARALALAVPAVVGYCEIRQSSYQAEGILPWPPLSAGSRPEQDDVEDVVAQVLATGSTIEVPTGPGPGRLLVLPLRSRAKVTGTLLVAAVGEAWLPPFAETLAGLVSLRLDLDPHLWEAGTVAEARLTLASRPQSAAVARGFVRDTLVRNGLAHQVDTAVLLVSELVSNAVRHGVGPYDLVVVCDDEGACVTVGDHSPASPRPRRPLHDMFSTTVAPGDESASGAPGGSLAGLDASGLDEDGRGLLLVEALADDWGWTAAAGGKRVWFRLAR